MGMKDEKIQQLEELMEIIGRVMKVVEANKYNFLSGVVSTEESSDDYYCWHKTSRNFFDFIFGNRNDTIYVKRPSSGGDNQNENDWFNISLSRYVGDNGRKSQVYNMLEILNDEELYAEVKRRLNDLLDRFKYNYDAVKDPEKFSLDIKTEAASKLAGSNVGAHIDTYMKKIAHAIETGTELKGFEGFERGPIILPEKETNIKLRLPAQTMYSTLSSVDESIDNFVPVLSYASVEDFWGDHDASFVLARICPKSIIEYNGQVSEDSKVLRELQLMHLQDVLCEYTSGLNSDATFEDVATAIHLRSKYKRVYPEFADQANLLLDGRGTVFPEEAIKPVPTESEQTKGFAKIMKIAQQFWS